MCDQVQDKAEVLADLCAELPPSPLLAAAPLKCLLHLLPQTADVALQAVEPPLDVLRRPVSVVFVVVLMVVRVVVARMAASEGSSSSEPLSRARPILGRTMSGALIAGGTRESTASGGMSAVIVSGATIE